MPKYAVMLRYEVVSGLVVEAQDEDEAAMLATEHEANLHDSIEDSDEIEVVIRSWGGGDVEIEESADADEAAELLEEWADEYEVDDEYDEDDLDDEEFDDFDESEAVDESDDEADADAEDAEAKRD